MVFHSALAGMDLSTTWTSMMDGLAVFASAPAMLRGLTGLPVIGPVAFVVGSLWMFVAMVVGVQHALDYRTVWRALAVCAAGWLVSFIFVAIIGFAFAPPVF